MFVSRTWPWFTAAGREALLQKDNMKKRSVSRRSHVTAAEFWCYEFRAFCGARGGSVDFWLPRCINRLMTVEEVSQKASPILEAYGVKYAAVFGSLARGDDRPESDVDMLVRLGRPTGMVGYMRLIESLEQCLQRKVDLVTEQSLNKYVRPYVLPNLKTIYEK